MIQAVTVSSSSTINGIFRGHYTFLSFHTVTSKMGECKLKNVMFSMSTFQEINILSLSKEWPIPMGGMAEGSF
jgi:hypothetical protein